MTSTMSPPGSGEAAPTSSTASTDQDQQQKQSQKHEDVQSRAKDFIAQERFNRSFTMPATDTHGQLVVTYAVGGRDSHQVPTLLLIGGLYGGRLMANLLDELAASFEMRLVVVDRPGMGGSTQVDPSIRLSVWLETVPILMRHLNASHLCLAAHSCGVIYALNTIYSQPWVLSPHNRKLYLFAPWVRPEHSGIAMLSAASYLPSSLVGSFDAIPRFFSNNIMPTVEFSGMLSGMVTGAARKKGQAGDDKANDSTATATATAAVGPSPAEFSARCKEMMRVLFQGNTDGANHEALLVLHKKPLDDWLACDDYVAYPDALDAKMRDFISSSLQDTGDPTTNTTKDDNNLVIRSFWAESDELIGKKGGQYFDRCFGRYSSTTSNDEGDGKKTCLIYESETILGTDHNTVFFPQHPGFSEVLRDINNGFAMGEL